MFPAGPIDDGQDDSGHQPADRISQHDHDEVRMGGKGCIEPEDTGAADADQDDDSRRQGIAIAPQGAGNDIDDTVDIERAADEKEPGHAEGDDVGVTIEQANQRRRKVQDRNGHDSKEGRFYDEGHFGDAEAAAQVAGAVVLADKGRRSLTEAVDEAIDVEFDDDSRCRSRHGSGAEAVDGRLDEDIG